MCRDRSCTMCCPGINIFKKKKKKQEHDTVESQTPMVAHGARLSDKTRPKLSARARLAHPLIRSTLHTLLSTLNKSCHITTAHPSSSSSPPTQETSDVCNDCDGGGHPTQNAAAAHCPNARQSWRDTPYAGAESPNLPSYLVLASGIVWASDQICTRAVLPAASR